MRSRPKSKNCANAIRYIKPYQWIANDPIRIATFVQEMPIGDSKYIRRFMVDNEPRLDLSKEVIAPSGERVMVDITFGVEFFRPFFGL